MAPRIRVPKGPPEELREPAFYLQELRRLTGESTAALGSLEEQLGYLEPSEAADDPLRLVREAKQQDQKTLQLIEQMEAFLSTASFIVASTPTDAVMRTQDAEIPVTVPRSMSLKPKAAGKASKIPQAVLEVLSVVRIEGTTVFLPPTQLERKLYQGVNAVLAELGGKWTRKVKAHVFAEDPTERLNDAMNAGEIVTAASLGFFATPPALATQLVLWAGIQEGQRVLEPSAGEGAIAQAVADVGAEVFCIEVDSQRATALRHRGLPVLCADFLESVWDDSDPPEYDAVVMNPPFAHQQDIDHVRKAFQYLRAGGRLVSVMGAGVLFRQDKKATAFREWVQLQQGTLEPLPAGSFLSSGTGVNTAVLRLMRSSSVR